MKRVILASLLMGNTLWSSAQKKHVTSRFEVEVDPIAYALSGYSFHGIYVKNKIRTDLGVFGITQPEGFNGNDGFQVKTQGFGIKINYLLNEKETWFCGIGFGYSMNKIKLVQTNQNQNHKIVGIGLHLGYRWFMFKNKQNSLKKLYLAPWFSIDYNNPLNSVTFQNKNYKQNAVSFFPTVHIGYKI